MLNGVPKGPSEAAKRLAIGTSFDPRVVDGVLARVGGDEGRAMGILHAAAQTNVSPLSLFGPVRGDSAGPAAPTTTADPPPRSTGSDGLLVERLIRSLRLAVEGARQALQRQHDRAMEEQGKLDQPGGNDNHEAGTRALGEALRLALAELRGAERMLEAVRHGEQHGPPVERHHARPFAIVSVSDPLRGGSALTLRADEPGAKELLARLHDMAMQMPLQAVAHVSVEFLPAEPAERSATP